MKGASIYIHDPLLELSVIGDTTKYLVLNSIEILHFHQKERDGPGSGGGWLARRRHPEGAVGAGSISTKLELV